ncbi:MAG: dTMP kinase [Proteobacteria bacterium]|nr:dTMP kinase [Pseudomonadota bacterium]
MNRGKFITFEGTDHAGKSTQANLLAEYLQQQRQLQIIRTREPGGTEVSERIREIALHEKNLDGISETLLMFAARREHVLRKIEPALASGAWVICDRFTDSTFAYQGGGRGVSLSLIQQLAQHVHPDTMPDLTFYLPSPPKSSSTPLLADETFEGEGNAFYQRTSEQFKQLARKHSQRIATIENQHGKKRRPRDDIAADIQQIIQQRFFSHEN